MQREHGHAPLMHTDMRFHLSCRYFTWTSTTALGHLRLEI